MKCINKLQILGNVVRDPAIKQTRNGQLVADLSVATEYIFKTSDGKEKKDIMFHSCEAWLGLAEIISKHVKKGDPILLEGRIKNYSWEGEDGQKRYKTKMVITDIFLMPRSKSSYEPSPPRPSKEEVSEEDLPF